MGEDVIVAHRLMKNQIQTDEYILISDALLAKYKGVVSSDTIEGMQSKKGHITVDHLGEICFQYLFFNSQNSGN